MARSGAEASYTARRWHTVGMAEYLVTNPCQDACGTVETERRVKGAPVYRCPGCDSEWIEASEISEPDVETAER